jgi:hypothetical protein
MSRRVIIVVEGDTEEEFVKDSVAPFLFQRHGIFDVRPIKVATSPGYKGGIGGYGKFRNDVTRYLKQEHDIVVTSLLDFFRLPPSFPAFKDSLKISDFADRIVFLEDAIAKDISDQMFLPYLQKFEFEALLFTDITGFEYCGITKSQKQELQKILADYPNPEDINDRPETAPSKRLQKIIPNYNKVLFGNVIIQEHGFPKLLEKCPRFAAWIEKIAELALR